MLFSCRGEDAELSLDWLVRSLIVLYDVRWLLLLSLLSALGMAVSEIAYAFCVVDVIPQVGARVGRVHHSYCWLSHLSCPDLDSVTDWWLAFRTDSSSCGLVIV